LKTNKKIDKDAEQITKADRSRMARDSQTAKTSTNSNNSIQIPRHATAAQPPAVPLQSK